MRDSLRIHQGSKALAERTGIRGGERIAEAETFPLPLKSEERMHPIHCDTRVVLLTIQFDGALK